MRHADSSPSIPPRFVAFARRYHPSTCGFAPSDARCCVHGLGLGEPVPAPPAVFTMETTRPPGFPGNPPARMPRAPTPARAPPPRPLRCGEITFRPTHDVGPHKQCISGLNHAAYGLPVNASRPGSTPGPRITRFRLAADLGRMGLDTHRVSNKVSKITSRHLVPLDRAFPAHALVHESKLARHGPNPSFLFNTPVQK